MVLRKAPEAGSAGIESQLPGLIQASPELLQATRIVVGFSGGLDSSVLLHLLHAASSSAVLAAPVHVLHINHAMQAEAEHWAEQCRQVCSSLGLPFEMVRTPVVAIAGESLEESARNARHAAFAAKLGEGEVLALAQHRDDQAETVLFRLLRGSGPAGLAGMPGSRSCGAGKLVRPLLDATRSELEHYAKFHELTWIEDASNADRRFDRNFLRTSILPLLKQRWPGLTATLTRSGRFAGEAAELMDELAAIDLRAISGSAPEQIPTEALLALSEIRQRNVLRYWLQNYCAKRALAAPTYQVLARIVPEMVHAVPDAEPLLNWGDGDKAVELRRHRGLLHVLAAMPPVPDSIDWTTAGTLALPVPLGTLELRACDGKGLARNRVSSLRVRFRSGGELVKPAGRSTRPLKKFLQEAGVPPWLRERIPLLYAGDELVAVADLLICDGWLAQGDETAGRIVWQHPDLDCGYPPHLLI